MIDNRKTASTTGETSVYPDSIRSVEQAEKEAYGDVPEQSTAPKKKDADEKPRSIKKAPESTPTSEMTLKQASELAKQTLSDALHKPANATISIEYEDDHWSAKVEIVEEEYLPGQNLKSMNDLLGVYEVTISTDGKLLKWTRKTSYKRAEIK